MSRELNPRLTPHYPPKPRSRSPIMPFTSKPTMAGVPDFGLIRIDPLETALAFQAYLDTASNLTGVSLDDIDLTIMSMPPDVSKVTLVDLLKHGMKLFDAVVWLTAGRPTTHPLREDPGMKQESIPSMHDVARSVFFCYFMLVTQARYPVRVTRADQPRIPNFLRTIMGMDKEQSEYVSIICSFEPQKFGPAWVRHVKFEGFGQEVQSRFGLGVAGYRMFGPFALYSPKSDMDANLRPAFEFARKVATAPASWDVHPLTRRPNVLKSRGNLNKNLGNLILDCFSQETIEEMVAAKVIYAIPAREPTHRQYKNWAEVDDITGQSIIFS